MRSWILLFSAMFASVASVMSVVIPFCLFLTLYHGDLFVSASDRSAQRGIEVMIYLTPFLIILAFISFWLILRCLTAPKRILEIKQILKVICVLALIWFCLIFLVQFLDGMINDILETLIFGSIGLIILAPPLVIGLISGNLIFLKFHQFILKKRISLFHLEKPFGFKI